MPDLVFDVRADSRQGFYHLWIVPGFADGGVHSCQEEGRRVQNEAIYAEDATATDLDGDGELDLLLGGATMDFDADGAVAVLYNDRIWGN